MISARLIWFLLAGSIVGAGLFFFLSNPSRLSPKEVLRALPQGFTANAENGKTLFYIGSCASCHESKSVEGVPVGAMGGGDPLDTPFGLFYPPNISSDASAGIGAWSDADFINAMTLGVSRDGRHYYPAFPYTSFAKVNYTDLLDLKAYLLTLPATSRRSPPHELAFPFNIRLGVGLWKLLFADLKAGSPNPKKDTLWNRGAYLANGLGHCGVCHTPRTIFLAENAKKAFFGAPPLKKGEKSAPRLAGLSKTKILNGLDEWSGSISDKSAMFHVTQAFSSFVSEEDQQALAEYFSQLPGE